MKKIVLSVFIFMLLLCLAGCKNNERKTAVTVISREDGSGTKTAFEDIFKIEQTTVNAEITNSTAVMINTVIGDKNSIGYISLGAINPDVKTIKIDGSECSAQNVKNGSYKIKRSLNIVTDGRINDIAKDFIKFSLSKEGQAVVEKSGYISIATEEQYNSANLKGEITVSGSSSVAPVVEKLKEEYIKLNPKVTIEIHQNDSTTGIGSIIDGIADIGMASRELKGSEIKKGLSSKTIALDGIAIIVNKKNLCDELSSEQINKIFSGIITNWNELRN